MKTQAYQGLQSQLLIENVSQRMSGHSYDTAKQSEFLALTGVSRATLHRYRQLAKLIPDYEMVSDRWHEFKFGESIVDRRIRSSRRTHFVLDKPPYCRRQMEILSAIASMYKQGLSTIEITCLLTNNPNIWRKYHAY